MLRKVRVDGPAERLDDLVEAARGAALSLDDYAIDRSAEYGWPSRADGRAYVLAIVDDDVSSVDDIVRAVRADHERRTGEPADWIEAGGSFVFLPDAIEPEWYEAVVPLAEALHIAEREADVGLIRSLRSALVVRVADAEPLARRRFAAFETFARAPSRSPSSGRATASRWATPLARSRRRAG